MIIAVQHTVRRVCHMTNEWQLKIVTFQLSSFKNQPLYLQNQWLNSCFFSHNNFSNNNCSCHFLLDAHEKKRTFNIINGFRFSKCRFSCAFPFFSISFSFVHCCYFQRTIFLYKKMLSFREGLVFNKLSLSKISQSAGTWWGNSIKTNDINGSFALTDILKSHKNPTCPSVIPVNNS